MTDLILSILGSLWDSDIARIIAGAIPVIAAMWGYGVVNNKLKIRKGRKIERAKQKEKDAKEYDDTRNRLDKIDTPVDAGDARKRLQSATDKLKGRNR